MITNNKLNKILGGVALASMLGFAACDVTDLQPDAAVGEGVAASTPEYVELSIIGMYDAAQSGFYNSSFAANRGYPFGAASIQQGDMRAEDMLNVALFFANTFNNIITPTTLNNVEMWNNLFALINQANVAIEVVETALENGVVEAAVANEYIGEARTLRALAYHELLVHFSSPYSQDPSRMGAPLRDFAINAPDRVEAAREIGRSSIAETYAFIIEDLNFAEANLPETRAGFQNTTRATKEAAVALKTRVYLHMEDWDNVLAEGAKIASGTVAPFSSTIGNAALSDDVTGPFANNDGPESIFSIDNNAADNPGPNGALAAMAGASSEGGRGLIAISPIIFNNQNWLADDLRRTELLTDDGRAYYTLKYTDYVNRSDNAPIIRYAEVLLNMAEAAARGGQGLNDQSLAYLNAVRNRAVTNEADQFTTASFGGVDEFIEAILMERRIEFLGEGLRWKDVHRLAPSPYGPDGIPGKMAYGDATFDVYDLEGQPELPLNYDALPFTDRRFVWPIPSEELALNPVLAQQQNPGW